MVNLIRKANSRKGRALHRWISIIVAAYVIMASVSGIVHIIMANFYSSPPPVVPQGLVSLDKASLPLSEIIKHIPDSSDVKAINIRTIHNGLWYQVITSAPTPIYINATDGQVDATLDETYAKELATAYLRKQEGVEKTNYLTSFNDEYLNIFRVLPVYRFDAANSGGEHVYVSTVTSSVTLYLNDARALGQYAFSYLHKFGFIKNRLAKDILQTILVLGIMATTFLGIAIFIARIRKEKAGSH